jgi:hypothetical protein
MRPFPAFPALAFHAVAALAGVPQGAELDYAVKVRLREQSAWTQGGFRLVVSPRLITRNRVQKPRMGKWHLEPLPGQGEALPPAVLARTLGMMYFSGPEASTLALSSTTTVGGRRCKLWQVVAPPGVAAYGYLAEVAPRLLALSYLSASLRQGEIGAVEIRLEGIRMGRRAAPAEDGNSLVRSIRRWSAELQSAETGDVPVEEVR